MKKYILIIFILLILPIFVNAVIIFDKNIESDPIAIHNNSDAVLNNLNITEDLIISDDGQGYDSGTDSWALTTAYIHEIYMNIFLGYFWDDHGDIYVNNSYTHNHLYVGDGTSLDLYIDYPNIMFNSTDGGNFTFESGNIIGNITASETDPIFTADKPNYYNTTQVNSTIDIKITEFNSTLDLSTGGIWTNVSNTATFEGQINVTSDTTYMYYESDGTLMIGKVVT